METSVRRTVALAVALVVSAALLSTGTTLVDAGTLPVDDGSPDSPARAAPASLGNSDADRWKRWVQLRPQTGLTPEADNTLTRIRVHENGTASWTLQVRTRLRTESDVETYERFQREFRNDSEKFRRPFRASMAGVVQNAERVTGRNMTLSSLTVATETQVVPRRWGVVSYRFQWHNFTATAGDRLLVGDVFEGGLFIAENDTLEVVAPAGYVVTSVEPAPDYGRNGTVGWSGREDFGDGRPSVELSPARTETDGWFDDAGVAVLAGLLALVVVGGALAVRRGTFRSTPTPANGNASVDHEAGDPGEDRDDDGGGGDEPEAPSAALGATDAGESSDEGPLLTDEDRVLALLDERGGRVRQRTVAEALDWSNSKTSRVLSRMAESGQISKLRLGRENVIERRDGTGSDESAGG